MDAMKEAGREEVWSVAESAEAGGALRELARDATRNAVMTVAYEAASSTSVRVDDLELGADSPGDLMRTAASYAAMSALAPIALQLRRSVVELVGRMLRE